MYIPKHYQNHNEAEIRNFIEQNGFGILVTKGDAKLLATHIPIELSADGGKLQGHISKANPQWKNFTSGDEVLSIFTGPHAYISSSWYDHENVPTWNYIAVHVYGTIEIIEGKRLHASLKTLVDKYERHQEKPVAIEGYSEGYFERQLRGLVGFEITISSIEAAYKLSQNRDAKNHSAIVDQLEKQNQHDSTMIAQAMKKNSATQTNNK
jgi:transcriptional regulator